MGDQRRWAARYQFLNELWQGRDRIVCDGELEAVLHAGVEGPLAGLLANLIPGEGSGERVWVALHNDRRAASFARERSGTVFLGVDESAEIASDEPWQVALVNLGEPSGGADSRADLLGPRASASSGLEAFLEVLGERVEDDAERSVVLSLACGADEDRSYELLAELVEELFGDARIYGLTRPSIVGFYDFGSVFEPGGLEPADGGGEGAVEFEIDNSLGDEDPRFEVFIAVIGARVPGEGVTLLELPAPTVDRSGERASGAASTGDDELAALRVQLAEAQRRGDLQAIERQALLEQLEQAEDRIAGFEETSESGTVEPASAAEAGPRVDELLTREQTLRWELERLRGELERAEARPVEALEAEIARLQAQLGGLQAQFERAEARLGEFEAADKAESFADSLADLAALEALDGLDSLDAIDSLDPLDSIIGADEPTPAQVREWRRAQSKLEHLLRKLERGGRLSALELHRELAGLRRLL